MEALYNTIFGISAKKDEIQREKMQNERDRIASYLYRIIEERYLTKLKEDRNFLKFYFSFRCDSDSVDYLIREGIVKKEELFLWRFTFKKKDYPLFYNSLINLNVLEVDNDESFEISVEHCPAFYETKYNIRMLSFYDYFENETSTYVIK